MLGAFRLYLFRIRNLLRTSILTVKNTQQFCMHLQANLVMLMYKEYTELLHTYYENVIVCATQFVKKIFDLTLFSNTR